MKNKLITNTILASLLAAGSSQAALVAGVTVAGFSAQNTGFNRLASYTVDSSGMTGLTPGVMGGQHDNSPSGGMWMESGGPDPTVADITYDLGGIFSLDSFQVWNYNEFGLPNRGFQDVVVTYGETAALGSTLASVTTFAQATGANGFNGEVFSFAPISARFFKIESTSNYGDVNETGLSEIQFNSVPEPSSTALLGLGGLALILRRRK